jgi:hypothetical protein
MTTTAPHSEHRELLAQSVADYVHRGTDIARVRRLRGAPAEYDRAAWKKMGELGWLGILVPESCGGLGLGLTEMAIVARGLARAPAAACRGRSARRARVAGDRRRA